MANICDTKTHQLVSQLLVRVISPVHAVNQKQNPNTSIAPYFPNLFIQPVCNTFSLFQLNHFIITMLEFVSAFSIASRRGFKKHFAAHLLVILVTFICILFYFARGFPNRQAFSLKSCITYGVRTVTFWCLNGSMEISEYPLPFL